MKIAVGSDERTNLTDTVIAELKQRGHDLEPCQYAGAQSESYFRSSG